MSNGLVVLIVTYAGICVGTFMNLRRLNNDFLKALLIAIMAPIPVFCVLAWAAASIAFDNDFVEKEQCSYFWLFVLSFTMYADAVVLLSFESSLTTKCLHNEAYKYEVKKYPLQVKRAIARNLVVA